MKCRIAGCWRAAEVETHLILTDERGVRSTVSGGVMVCGVHRGQITVRALLSDDMWREIRREFTRRGRMIPTRAKTTLGFSEVS